MAIQLKRSLTSEIDAAYVLLQGQVGIEMPETVNSEAKPFKVKIGDGTSPWSTLPYLCGTAVSGGGVIGSIPTQYGEPVYTGEEIELELNGFDPSGMILGGTTSATDAGSYVATVTLKAGYYWSDGKSDTKDINWVIKPANVGNVPTITGSYTYNGSRITPTWSGLDTSTMTLSGDTSGTNAGSYDAVVSIDSNHCWSDGSTGSKSVSWRIQQARPSLGVSPTSLNLSSGSMTKTATITYNGDGTLSATSGNTNIATCSLSGKTLTVTAKQGGSTAITISATAGTNYSKPSNISVSLTVSLPSSTLESNSWSIIGEVGAAGTGASFWSTGDIKQTVLNGTVQGYTFNNLSVGVFIIGFNHNESREGKGIHFMYGKISGKDIAFVDSHYGSSASSGFTMNTTDTNSGGWKNSYGRNTLLGNSGTPSSPPANSFMSAMPAEIRAVLGGVTKYSDNTGGGSDNASYVTSTIDYVTFAAEFEVHGTRTYANSAEKNYQQQYEYFRSGNSKVAYQHSNTGTAVWWWNRSVYATYTYGFCSVYTDGSAHADSANYSFGVRPVFCANRAA